MTKGEPRERFEKFYWLPLLYAVRIAVSEINKSR